MSDIVELVPVERAEIAPLPALEQVRQYIRASKAESTLRGYQSDWRAFCAWCEGHGQRPLPATPETVAAYIAECAEHLKPGSIQRRLNAIAEAHKAIGAGVADAHAPVVANIMKGIRRTLGTAPVQKAPALTDDIRAMVDGHGRGHHRRSGPCADPAGVRGCIPPLGVGWVRRGGLQLRQGRADGDPAPIQDGPDRRGAQDRHPLRQQPRYVPRARRFRRGWSRRRSPRGRCSAPSTGTGRCRRAGCLVSTWRGW